MKLDAMKEILVSCLLVSFDGFLSRCNVRIGLAFTPGLLRRSCGVFGLLHVYPGGILVTGHLLAMIS